jgi:hypothetical protein
MTEDLKVKKARTFGLSYEREMMRAAVLNKRDQLVKNITCDFKTWQLQWAANHGELNNTMQRLIDDFGLLLSMKKLGHLPEEND